MDKKMKETNEEKDTGFYDDVGGYHDCGIGWSPSGNWCGECNLASCKNCPSKGEESMIKIENAKITGWEPAIKVLRQNNEFDGYGSDSCHYTSAVRPAIEGVETVEFDNGSTKRYIGYLLGDNDIDLMKKMIKDNNIDLIHKFMRMITVYADITAPLYWWGEFNAYNPNNIVNKFNIIRNIEEKEFTIDDFSHKKLSEELVGINGFPDGVIPIDILLNTIDMLNYYRKSYLEDGNTDSDFYHMMQLLPYSYNYKSTVIMNYDILKNIYDSNKDSKLDEWNDFYNWIKTSLPYSWLIIPR